MGGHGSGRQFWTSRKATVERCLCLSVSEFSKIIKFGVSGNINWINQQTGDEYSSISFMLLPETDAEPMLILSYRMKGKEVEEPIFFQKTYPHFGGIRWWFSCPMCKKRVGRLYLPVKRHLFACRMCHNLTYRSSQNSKKFDVLYRIIAVSTGTTPVMVKELFNSPASK